AVAVVRVPAGDELLRHAAIAIEAFGLEVRAIGTANLRALVPVDAEPAEPVEDPFDHLVRRALDVRVLDAEDEDAAEPSRVQPVEERGARAADMQIPGRRWGEADADHVVICGANPR